LATPVTDLLFIPTIALPTVLVNADAGAAPLKVEAVILAAFLIYISELVPH